MTTKNVTYKFRLYPNKKQKVFFAKTFGCTRFIWNKMFADKQEHYKKHKGSIFPTPAQYKSEYPFLKEVDSLALSNAQQDLKTAYARFLKI